MSQAPPFTWTVQVASGDIDRQGHVNNVAFLRFVQEAATAHWLALAPDQLKQSFTWVVRRHEIEYLRPGLPGDELLVKTWVGEPSGATWERFTEIRRSGDDRPLVSARTVWVLLDAATGRPRRVDAGFVACFQGHA
jgi:acyl-CoA thioester hydrolase